MTGSRDFLRSMGLPGGDPVNAPASTLRFPDGGQYRIEIPSTQGPRALEQALAEAARRKVGVEVIVPQKLVHHAVIFVRAALGRDVDNTAARVAELRRVGRGFHFELRHRFKRHRISLPATGESARLTAVHQHRVLHRQAAADPGIRRASDSARAISALRQERKSSQQFSGLAPGCWQRRSPPHGMARIG